MIVRFTASSQRSAFDEDNDPQLVYVFMADSLHNYLMLSRAQPVGDSEDWCVLIEVNDQIHSAYEQVARCELTSDVLGIVLTKPLGRRGEIEGIEVPFTTECRPNSEFIEHLRQIFIDREHLLHIAPTRE